MSLVTEIIICIDSLDERLIDEINDLVREDFGEFGVVDPHQGGGTKVFCSILLFAAFNYFRLEEFLDNFKKVMKKRYCDWWIMYDDEGTYGWRLIKKEEEE